MQGNTPFGMGFPRRAQPTPKEPEKLSKFGEVYTKTMGYKRKYSWIVNYAIFYGWIPFAVYKGLNSGTHKFVKDTPQGPRPESRPPRVGDLVPILGSHG
eukprot:230095_1